MLSRKVEVVLMERVEKLGQMGQVVAVAPGYARNFLFPQKKALRATKENLSHFETQRAQLEAHNLKRRQDAEFVSKSMEGAQVVVIRQASEVGHLYGSVRSRDISDALTANGFTVSKEQIVIKNPIKTLGKHTIHVVLHPEVHVDVSVLIAQSEEEAAQQQKDSSENTTA
jgi:large subunit ribosomal protein L9